MPRDFRPVDLDDLDALATAADAAGLARLMGMRLVEVGPGLARARMTIDERHENFYGQTHGAALFALADHVCSVAGNSAGRRAVMVSCSVYLLGNPEPGATIEATGRLTRTGRNLGHIEIEIRDQQDRRILQKVAQVFFLDPPAAG